MFNKDNPRETASTAVQRAPGESREADRPSEEAESVASRPVIESSELTVQRRNVSVIGPRMVFKGDLTAGEDVVIHGRIEGTIAHQSQNVFVGKDGSVRAMIHAKSITVEGKVEGEIHGDEFVELRAGSTVDGDIYCADLRIASGARFNGSVHTA